MPGTFVFDGSPGGGFELFDADNDLVQCRTADDGFDTPGPDVQMADGTIPDIGPPTRQAVGITLQRHLSALQNLPLQNGGFAGASDQGHEFLKCPQLVVLQSMFI